MAWKEQWSIKIGSYELNTLGYNADPVELVHTFDSIFDDISFETYGADTDSVHTFSSAFPSSAFSQSDVGAGAGAYQRDSFQTDAFPPAAVAIPWQGFFVAQIPEIENLPDFEVISVPIDGTYPSYIRLQPKEAQWTLNINMRACTWAEYNEALTWLKGVLTAGVVHTLTVHVRGMSSPKSTKVVVRGMLVSAKERAVSVMLHVPKPILT